LSQWLTPTQQFKDALLKERFVQSFKRPGVWTDNAHMESLFYSMNTEATEGHKL
jgi:transposase InsO family protein